MLQVWRSGCARRRAAHPRAVRRLAHPSARPPHLAGVSEHHPHPGGPRGPAHPPRAPRAHPTFPGPHLVHWDLQFSAVSSLTMAI